MKAAQSVDIKGKLGEKVKLPDSVFGVETSPKTVAIAIRAYLANQRSARAKTKTRSEVEKTTAKMYRQKGTGRARHGSYAAPIFVGGGVAHGPTGTQNYKINLPKSVRRMSVLGAMSLKATDGKIWVVEDEDKIQGNTKEAALIRKSCGLDTEGMVVVRGVKQMKVKLAFQNLPKTEILTPNQINTYNILKTNKLLFTSQGLKETVALLES